MKPAGERLAFADRGSLARQGEEGSLEDVFGILFVAEHVPGDRHDQAPVAVHEGRESALVPMRRELLEQVPIGEFPARLRRCQLPKVSQYQAQLHTGHRFNPR
jgi:hypothetical protein